MLKTELINLIEDKVKSANSTVKAHFLNGLKYKTKRELEQLLERVKVDEDGCGIEL